MSCMLCSRRQHIAVGFCHVIMCAQRARVPLSTLPATPTAPHSPLPCRAVSRAFSQSRMSPASLLRVFMRRANVLT
jgi:hypothetical protein